MFINCSKISSLVVFNQAVEYVNECSHYILILSYNPRRLLSKIPFKKIGEIVALKRIDNLLHKALQSVQISCQRQCEIVLTRIANHVCSRVIHIEFGRWKQPAMLKMVQMKVWANKYAAPLQSVRHRDPGFCQNCE